MEEAEYRKLIREIFDRIERAFENVDPDAAECDHAGGALTITLADGSKTILSAQPSVRQLWLAVAARGKGYHFNFDAQKQQWRDDKDSSVELVSFLHDFLRDAAQVDVKF